MMGGGSSRIRIPVTRPAQVNLKDFDKIAFGEIKGSGSVFLQKEESVTNLGNKESLR